MERTIHLLRTPSGHSSVFSGKWVAPGRQRREGYVPADDFKKYLDGEPHALSRRHQRADGEIGDRQPFAEELGLASQQVIA